MKMIFIILATLFSLSAFSAAKTNVTCILADNSGRQIDVEMKFKNWESVTSYLTVDQLKIPLTKSEFVFAFGFYFVESVLGLENGQNVIFALPARIFSDRYDTSWVEAQVDGIDQMAYCRVF